MNNDWFNHKMILAKSFFKHKNLQYFKEPLSYFSQKHTKPSISTQTGGCDALSLPKCSPTPTHRWVLQTAQSPIYCAFGCYFNSTLKLSFAFKALNTFKIVSNLASVRLFSILEICAFFTPINSPSCA